MWQIFTIVTGGEQLILDLHHKHGLYEWWTVWQGPAAGGDGFALMQNMIGLFELFVIPVVMGERRERAYFFFIHSRESVPDCTLHSCLVCKKAAVGSRGLTPLMIITPNVVVGYVFLTSLFM